MHFYSRPLIPDERLIILNNFQLASSSYKLFLVISYFWQLLYPSFDKNKYKMRNVIISSFHDM